MELTTWSGSRIPFSVRLLPAWALGWLRAWWSGHTMPARTMANAPRSITVNLFYDARQFFDFRLDKTACLEIVRKWSNYWAECPWGNGTGASPAFAAVQELVWIQANDDLLPAVREHVADAVIFTSALGLALTRMHRIERTDIRYAQDLSSCLYWSDLHGLVTVRFLANEPGSFPIKRA